jgi:GDP-4-dehydro-6-deoxy-D-mannose reductase
MKKYLITGFSGFVSFHFLNYLENLHTDNSVLGVDINEPAFNINEYKHVKCTFDKINLLNKEQVDKTIYDYQPDYILHLASYSSVAYSWINPVESFVNNTNIFLNLVEQVRILGLKCRILSVGSSEEYGKVAPGHLPLHEDLFVNPLSPYAVARVSQEMLSKIYCNSLGADIIITRSFNHIGPHQSEVFVISSLAKKLVTIKHSSSNDRQITVGNINIVRDFVDVRDVVKAYDLLLHKGTKGGVYNICSGVGISIKQVLEQMMAILNFKVEPVIDETLVRPADNEIIIGSYDKIKKETGWEPKIKFKDSLIDVINYWISKI